MRLLQEPGTNDSSAQGNQGPVDSAVGIGSQPEFAKAMQPGVGTLDHPAVDPQPTAVLRPPLRDLGLDSALAQPLAVRFGVVGPVGILFPGFGRLVPVCAR